MLDDKIKTTPNTSSQLKRFMSNHASLGTQLHMEELLQSCMNEAGKTYISIFALIIQQMQDALQ